MTDTMASQKVDISFWDILHIGTSVLSTLSNIADAWLALMLRSSLYLETRYSDLDI
jgi:hypothetical protein